MRTREILSPALATAPKKEKLPLEVVPGSTLTLKICAFEGWPGTYTFFERDGKKIRVQILEAHLENGQLVLDTVKPEGKQKMPYSDFARSGARALAS